jgi:hypothetical protein
MDLDFVGDSSFASTVTQAAKELLDATIIAPGVEVKVRTFTNRVTPPLALDELACGRGIVSALARAIVGIERGDGSSGRESVELIRDVMAAVQSRPLEGMIMVGDREVNMPLPHEEIRRRAAAAARRLLSAMIQGGGLGAMDSSGNLS